MKFTRKTSPIKFMYNIDKCNNFVNSHKRKFKSKFRIFIAYIYHFLKKNNLYVNIYATKKLNKIYFKSIKNA